MNVIDELFKAYDVRGLAKDINPELARKIARAFVKHKQLKTCVVGRDGRTSSPALRDAIVKGLTEMGCEVIDIGLASTPVTKWSVAHLGTDGGIMVSASHKPPEYNGMKFYTQGGMSYGEANGLHALKDMLDLEPIATANITEQDTIDAYVDALLNVLDTSDTHIFLDTSGGVAIREVKRLIEKGNFNITLYNDEIDPDFKVHSPNPLDADAQEAAKTYCAMNKCLGVIFDADADRLIVIDEDGHDIQADYLGAYLVEHTVPDGKGIVATVNSTRAIRELTESKKGSFALCPVGHANVMKAMVEHNAYLAIEKSGHIFWQEMASAEAPLYTLLTILKHLEGRLADQVKQYRENYLSSTEHNVRVEDKTGLLKAASEHYQEKGTLITMDGMLCEGENWWVSIRASNTGPVIRITWEARDQETYNALKEEALELVKPFITDQG